MRAFIKLLDPLRRVGAAFFKHDLALRRDAAGLQIVMEARPEPKPQAEKGSRRDGLQEKDKQKAKRELAQIVEQLGILLAEVPESRSALRHLEFVEGALKKKGLRALSKLPVEVLERALEQLESLVTNWSPVGLASLRSKMAVAIMEREHADPVVAQEAAASDFVADTMLPPMDEDPEPDGSEADALAAAYAALVDAGPSGPIEFHSELGSLSAKAMAPALPRVTASTEELQLREVQPREVQN